LLDRALNAVWRRLQMAQEREHIQEVWRQFDMGAVLGSGVQLGYSARLVNRAGEKDRVRVGNHTIVRGLLRNEATGRIDIGSGVYIGDGVLISAAQSVEVGDFTLMAHGVQIFDNASHPIDPDERAAHTRMIFGLEPKRKIDIPSRPVVIGRNCWIAFNAIVLPGAIVGDGSIVSAGSIVQGEVPPGVIYRCSAGGTPSMKALAT
jgi:acetyltransferase-like isoleucine patch superfamily enzyme